MQRQVRRLKYSCAGRLGFSGWLALALWCSLSTAEPRRAVAAPVISVSPDSLVDSLHTGGRSTRTVTIANSGSSELTFRLALNVVSVPPPSLTVDQVAARLSARAGIVESAANGEWEFAPLDTGLHSAAAPPRSSASVARSTVTSPQAPDVAILAAEFSTYVSGVQQQLLATSKFATVTMIDVRYVTPTQAELQAFDAVLVWRNYSYSNRNLLGDVLADYVDAGGGVVCAVFEVAGGSSWLGGRWESEQYFVVERSPRLCCDNRSMGEVAQPYHPIMAGVSDFEGGAASYRPGTSSLTPGSTLIASWSDGMPLVASKSINGSRRVDLGFFPLSSEVQPYLWQADGDGYLLMANALEWASSFWIDCSAKEGTVPAGSYVDLEVEWDARGLKGGDYLARLAVASNDSLSPLIEVPAHLVVMDAPDVSPSDTLLDFGLTYTGTTTFDTVVVYNSGTLPLSVSQVSVAPPEFSAPALGFNLPPGAGQMVIVSYSPLSVGDFHGTLTMASDDPDEPSAVVQLTGSSLDPPVIVVTPDSISDSLNTGETSTHAITIANTGLSDLVFHVSPDSTSPSPPLSVQAAVESLIQRSGAEVTSKKGTRAIDRFNLQAPRDASLRGTVAHTARPARSGAAAPDVALVAAEEPILVADVQDLLLSTGRFGSVTVIQAHLITPSLSELRAFDAVLVWSDYEFDNSEALGDALADYVDLGGGVVSAVFELDGNGNISLRGRWESQQYYLLERAGTKCCENASLGVVDNPYHPVMAGVTSFGGGYAAYRPYSEILMPGSHLIASWSDGMPLVVVRNTLLSNRVDLGFFPPSGRVYSDFWDPATDGTLLMANALEWVSRPWMRVEPDSGVVPAGQEMDLTLSFDASSVVGGLYRADLNIACNDPASPAVLLPVRLRVTGTPEIEVLPASIDFGMTFTGTTATDTVVIRNAGTDVLTLTAFSAEPAEFSVDLTGLSLSPGERHRLAVSFSPTAAAPTSGSLYIGSDDPDEPLVEVLLSGTGLDPPIISVTPDTLTDSLPVGDTSIHELTIHNGGASELHFAIRFDGTSAPLLTQPTPTDASYASPARAVGPDVALVTASSSERVEDVRAHLLATGAFHSVTWIDVGSVRPTLTELQAFDALLVWRHYSYFDSEALGDTLAAYVDAGGGVVCALFEVTGSPALGGRWLADQYYVMERNGYRCCDQTQLGTVWEPAHPIMAGVDSFHGGYGSFRPNTTTLVAGSKLIASWSDGMPLVATRDLGPARRVDLGFHPPSSRIHSDFWQDGSDGDLLLAHALLWVSVPWLSAQPESGVVPAGGQLNVSIRFDATRLYGGHFTADLHVASNDPVSPDAIVPTFLRVTGIPELALSDEELDFGNQFLNSETRDTLVLSNQGTDQLSFRLAASGSAEFAVDTGSFNVKPGAERTFEVIFAPTSLGLKAGTLILESNDPDESPAHVALLGAGIETPAIELATDVLAESLFVGETHTRLLSLSNTGHSDLTFEVLLEPWHPPTWTGPGAATSTSGPAVCVMAATYTGNNYYLKAVADMLLATGRFSSVDTLNVGYQTPTLAKLLEYDAVLVWSDYSIANSVVMGNNLADYVDHGGGVVCAMYESAGYPYARLGGRWEAGQYNVFARSNYKTSYFASLGEVKAPRHPLMQGVREFDGGIASLRPSSASLSAGSQLIANWSDSMPLVATKQMAVARRVDLGFYPPSNTSRYDSWVASTDGDQLLANALEWVSRSWVDVLPGSGTVAAGEHLELTVSFRTEQLEAGPYDALLVVASNDPLQPRLEVATHLVALPALVGDCNGDGGVNARDIIHLVNYVFRSGPAPRGQSGDFSCDFAITVIDVIQLVNHMFKGGPLETCP